MSKASDQKKKIPRKNVDLAFQNTPDRIISATLKLLSTKCLHSISIRATSREAKVNSALISYHFENEENLYKSIITSQFKVYLDQETFNTIDEYTDFTCQMLLGSIGNESSKMN